MPSRARLEWNGDRLIERARRVAAAAVNETLDATRDDARATHKWEEDPNLRTLKSGVRADTHLEPQIETRHADAIDHNPAGAVGYTRRKGFVGLFHEEGTVHEHEFPALRPAADRQFPTLSEKVRRRWSK